MDKYYVLCDCKNRAYLIPGEPNTFFCSYCERKFESKKKPKIERGIGLGEEESPGSVSHDKEEEEMSKRGTCKECGRDGMSLTTGELCGKCYAAKRKAEGNPVGMKKKRGRKKGAKKGKKKVMNGVSLSGPAKKAVTAREEFRTAMNLCDSCAHKKVCGITPTCKDYMPIR